MTLKWICAIVLMCSGILQLLGVFALGAIAAGIVTLTYGLYILGDVLGEGE